jgi:uncharacterized membrane protein
MTRFQVDHTEPAEAPIPEPPLIHRVELAISYILRGGVVISIMLVALGSVMSFLHHPEYTTHAQPLKEIPQVAQHFPTTLADTWVSVKEFRGQGLVVVGLLVLLLTPVIRVAASIIAFTLQRDWIFVLITAIVLTILILSFFLGKTEGG